MTALPPLSSEPESGHIATVAVARGLEADRPRMAPSVWKLFAHSLGRQCFVSDQYFPWLPTSRLFVAVKSHGLR